MKKEEEIIADKWYQIDVVGLANNTFYFKPSRDSSGQSPRIYFTPGGSFSQNSGSLSQSNSAFRGNSYRELDEDECRWAEECVLKNRFTVYTKPEIPKLSLLF